MAHKPPSKGRIQQTLKKRLAVEAVRAVREIKRSAPRDPARHAWLVRHVERQNGRCAYCGVPMFMSPQRGRADCRATLDHVVPRALGGADSERNTVAACEACNAAKGHMNAQLYGLSPFCMARKECAKTVPPPELPRPASAKKPTVVVRKRRHRS